jgi:hypothetical protein
VLGSLRRRDENVMQERDCDVSHAPQAGMFKHPDRVKITGDSLFAETPMIVIIRVGIEDSGKHIRTEKHKSRNVGNYKTRKRLDVGNGIGMLRCDIEVVGGCCSRVFLGS